jgi:hypothetical protein
LFFSSDGYSNIDSGSIFMELKIQLNVVILNLS